MKTHGKRMETHEKRMKTHEKRMKTHGKRTAATPTPTALVLIGDHIDGYHTGFTLQCHKSSLFSRRIIIFY